MLLTLFAHRETLAAETLGPPAHGLSAFGDLKYPKGFAHFDYVNPAAPKGGAIAMSGTSGTLTFDSLNPFILKGDTPEGLLLLDHDVGSNGMGSLVFESLMIRAGDEPDAIYSLLAESVEMTADRARAVFHLNPAARFHDGSPLTADDVVFTIKTLKEKGHPNFRFPLRDVSVSKKDAQTIEFRFAGNAKRDAVLFAAQVPISSAAYYKAHTFEETTLDRPLGSGPYKVGAFKPGSYIDYERVPGYWGKDLNVNRGRWNFDRIRYEYYPDRTVGFQAFTAGTYDLREEFTARVWATAYDFPAVREKRVLRTTLRDATPSGTQGFFLNTRRPQLKDPRVRQALGMAFDFEWLNKTLFFGQYARTASYFQNSDMMAVGAPSAGELALLEPFRDRLPPEVFAPVHVPPVSDGSGDNRANLRKAKALLTAAGCVVKDGKLLTPAGTPFTLEFLVDESSMADRIQPYMQSLRALGIGADIRLVDPAQYERRRKSFDFDVVIVRYSQRLTPGIELRQYYSAEAAGAEGSSNYSGIADPVVDALVEAVIAAQSRSELVTAVRALDRVLRAGHYWVPHWYKASHTIAFWNKFAWPNTKAPYQRGIIDTWWMKGG